MQLCGGCEIADYPCIVVEILDHSLVTTLCAKYALVRGSGGMPPWNLGSLRVHSWLSTSQLVKHKLIESALD